MERGEFEVALARLEEIVEILERGDLSLDESLSLFEEGVRMSKLCSERLNAARERVQKLLKTEKGEFKLESLDIEGL